MSFASLYWRSSVCTRVYKCLHVFTSVYKCLQVFTSVYKCLQVFTSGGVRGVRGGRVEGDVKGEREAGGGARGEGGEGK